MRKDCAKIVIALLFSLTATLSLNAKESSSSAIAAGQPVIAAHGMVASQDRLATRIGVDVLRRGGNAVDAAVAVAFALAVTLPEAGNLGGGGFMLIHLAHPARNVAIDYRERAPADTPRNVFLDKDGNAVPHKSRDTGLAVGVPGTVAGLAYALQHYGSGKFTLAELAAPAIALARQGIIVDQDLAASLAHAAPRLARWPSTAKIFLHKNGTPLRQGELLLQKDLAASLEAIAADGPSGFYKGPIAKKIVAAVNAAGGHMTLADMESYKPLERKPIKGTYRGYEIVTMPPPSSGGVALIELLNILEGFPLAKLGASSPETIHLMAEAMKPVYADRARYMGDPDRVKMPIRGLTDKAYAARLRAAISPAKARPATAIMAGNPLPYESPQTTHFSIVDAVGDAVSNTYTLNFSFGVGLVAEGTGILLNNELDDFAAKPGAPNAYGLLGGAANAPAGGKRPLSSMTPAMVFQNGALRLVTGSPGGSRIITIVAQILLDCIDFHMNVAQAEAAIRIHDQWLPDELQVEPGLPAATLQKLTAMGHTIHQFAPWGSAQSIMRNGNHWEGASDPRQHDGLAAGY
ncbi:MAG: gamma-glutamyltransferase [Beijerinckiaceae bacterium]|nr:MAG: gamma-glutamyltransferase [Beijerinckiaceae bacterium]